MQRSSIASFLRRESRRVVPPCGERPNGTGALVSVSYAFRQHKRRQAADARWQERKAAYEKRERDRLRRARDNGLVERFRALGWDAEADDLERQIAQLQ